MAVDHTPATLTGLTEALRLALPRWGLPAGAALDLLAVSENATFRASSLEGDPPIVLRAHRLTYHCAEEIGSEIAWIEALRRERVVETPAPLPGRDGQSVQTLPSLAGSPDRHVVAFAFAAGAEPAPDADLPAWFSKLGSITARMHGHAQRWVPPAGFRRKTWDVDGMFGPQAPWGDWRAGVGLDAGGRAVIERAIALIHRRLHRFGRAPARFGLIHADLRLANLLVDGPRLQVIDFDDCGFGWHLYDFAAAVSFFEHEPIVDTLLASWLDGYRAVAPLPDADAAEIPVFIAMRRFLLVAWIASHPEVPIAQDFGAAYTAGAVDMAGQLLAMFD